MVSGDLSAAVVVAFIHNKSTQIGGRRCRVAPQPLGAPPRHYPLPGCFGSTVKRHPKRAHLHPPPTLSPYVFVFLLSCPKIAIFASHKTISETYSKRLPLRRRQIWILTLSQPVSQRKVDSFWIACKPAEIQIPRIQLMLKMSREVVAAM